MNIPSYLERINYRGSLTPTAQTLRELQWAHLLSVPFENLSIHYHQPIVLEDEALFSKIVSQRRGGFCYELNGLFASLLRALGFEVEMLSARVANAAGEFGPDFDHMTLLVHLDDRWLVDVGFGDSFRRPILLDQREPQHQDGRDYKVTEDRARVTLWQRESESDWKAQYNFTLKPFTFPDYAAMCVYHQTSPESHFTRQKLCTRATDAGRLTLSDLRFITTENGKRDERLLKNEEEYATVLKEHFGIILPAQVQT